MWTIPALLLLSLSGQFVVSDTSILGNNEDFASVGGKQSNETTAYEFSTEPESTANVPILPKCCPMNESLVRTSGSEKPVCAKTYLSFEPEFWAPNNETQPGLEVMLHIGRHCKEGSYRLQPYNDSMDEFHIRTDGYLYVPYLADELISPADYCLESFEIEKGVVMVLPLVCFHPEAPKDPWKEAALILYPIGCLISVPFLLATAFIYLFIKELRDLQGKILVCYCFCLAFAYLCLAIVQIWGVEMEKDICIIVAYMIQFCFLACFFWLNVMCFHTWRKMRIDVFKKKGIRNENRTFAHYSLYGWGIPLLILFFSISMDLLPTIPPSYIKPNFGTEACWFQNDTASFTYFYGPMSILLIINVIFFFLTVKYLHLNTSKSQMIHFQDVAKQAMINRRRHIFIQCLMLFCVMGLSWILEVLSWKYGGKPAQFWIFIDGVNTLQGVVILLVFVIGDERVKNLLARAIRKKPEQPSPESAPLNNTV